MIIDPFILIDVLILRDRDKDGYGNSERLYAMDNANFDVIRTVNTTGAEVESWTYTPYGMPIMYGAQGISYSQVDWAIGHQGLYHDDILELVYNRARTYHPLMGRFMQRDPVDYLEGMSLASLQPDSGMDEPVRVGAGGVAEDARVISGDQEERLTGQRQYVDGMSIYQYLVSNPLRYADALGTNIYLLQGNNSGNVGNDVLHLSVGFGKCENGKITIKVAWSFAVTGNANDPRTWTHRKLKRAMANWLGFTVTVPASDEYFVGEIYPTNRFYSHILGTKETTPQQDELWRRYMLKRVHRRDVYSLVPFNCDFYSLLEFAAAPEGVK